MSQRTVGSWLQQWTCVAGTCAPPAPAARTPLERAMDMYVGWTAPVLRGCWAIPIALAVFLLTRAIGPDGLYLASLYLGAYAAYCLANFARCREAHCIITGLGWGVLALVAFLAAMMRLDWFGPIWNAFLIVFVVGHGFELIWVAFRHTHALRV